MGRVEGGKVECKKLDSAHDFLMLRTVPLQGPEANAWRHSTSGGAASSEQSYPTNAGCSRIACSISCPPSESARNAW